MKFELQETIIIQSKDVNETSYYPKPLFAQIGFVTNENVTLGPNPITVPINSYSTQNVTQNANLRFKGVQGYTVKLEDTQSDDFYSIANLKFIFSPPQEIN